MAQLSYGAGLLLVVPLGDLIENRRLVLSILCVAILALTGAVLSTHVATFLGAAVLIGLGSVAVQVLVPYAAHLAPDAVRGRVVGNVMSGLMLGIMLARPVASLITEALSWHAVFALSAALMAGRPSYCGWPCRGASPLRGCNMASCWPPWAGWLGGRLFCNAAPCIRPACSPPSACSGRRRRCCSPTLSTCRRTASPCSHWSGRRRRGAHCGPRRRPRLGLDGFWPGLAILVTAAVLLDFGVTANGVLGQRAIYQLGAGVRSRLNGLYMATFFAGGAAGSALGGWTYAHGGWPLTMWAGLGLPMLALACFLTERPKNPFDGDHS